MPLTASILDISTLGLLTIKFNQPVREDLFTAQDINDQVIYLEMVPGEYEKPAYYDISNLNFVWETVKMDFANNQLQI